MGVGATDLSVLFGRHLLAAFLRNGFREVQSAGQNLESRSHVTPLPTTSDGRTARTSPWHPMLAGLLVLILCATALAQDKRPTEDDYYRMVTIPLPKDVVLEVGGLDWLDKQKTRLLACTRRGEVWLIDNPYADAPTLGLHKGETLPEGADEKNVVRFTQYLFGLHEPLGLLAPARRHLHGAAQRTHADSRHRSATTGSTWSRPSATNGKSAAATTSTPSGPSSTARGGCGSRSTAPSAASRKGTPTGAAGRSPSTKKATCTRSARASARPPVSARTPPATCSTPTTRETGWPSASSAISSRAASRAIRWRSPRATSRSRRSSIPANRPSGLKWPTPPTSTRPSCSRPCGSPIRGWASRAATCSPTTPAASSAPSQDRSSSATSPPSIVVARVPGEGRRRVPGRVLPVPRSGSSAACCGCAGGPTARCSSAKRTAAGARPAASRTGSTAGLERRDAVRGARDAGRRPTVST